MNKKFTKQQIRFGQQVAKELLSYALSDVVQNWHTREVEVYGKAPLSDAEQELINIELAKITQRLRKSLAR